MQGVLDGDLDELVRAELNRRAGVAAGADVLGHRGGPHRTQALGREPYGYPCMGYSLIGLNASGFMSVYAPTIA